MPERRPCEATEPRTGIRCSKSLGHVNQHAYDSDPMPADPAPSTAERLAAALRHTFGGANGWAITVSQGTSWGAIARAILAADPSLLDAARQQGAAEERARLRELMTSMALSLGWSHDLYAALVSWLAEPDAALASPPDAEPPAEEHKPRREFIRDKCYPAAHALGYYCPGCGLP